MTPEAIFQRMQAMYDDFGTLLNDVRVVFRERDAQWRKAFWGSHYDPTVHWCPDCAPLRALLETK